MKLTLLADLEALEREGSRLARARARAGGERARGREGERARGARRRGGVGTDRLGVEMLAVDRVELEQRCERRHRRALLLHLRDERGAAHRHRGATEPASPDRLTDLYPAELTLLPGAVGEDGGGARLGILGLRT